MITSMTGFAAVSGEVPGGRFALELKTVNHRYLEFQTRMPEDLRSLEASIGAVPPNSRGPEPASHQGFKKATKRSLDRSNQRPPRPFSSQEEKGLDGR